MNRTMLVVALVSAPISAAFAHANLKSSVPADGSTVAKAPAELVLNFSEGARVTALTVQKDGGAKQKVSPLPATSAAQARIAAPRLEDGHYTVTWRVASGDGHVMNGKFSFTVGGKPSPGNPVHEGHADRH